MWKGIAALLTLTKIGNLPSFPSSLRKNRDAAWVSRLLFTRTSIIWSSDKLRLSAMYHRPDPVFGVAV